MEDYKNHSCICDCVSPLVNMICTYEFTAEWYSVLSKSCFNCTHNETDCFRPNCISANGVQRAVKVINRMLPGPAIQVCQGDTVIVTLTNMLHSFEATTIHWHGLKQKGTPHMDGVGMLTQCPITPMTSFEYKFDAVDPGTHFWHAHSAGQRSDGLFGPIIIRESNDVNAKLYDVDSKDHVVVVHDWMNQIIISKYTAFLFTSGDEIIDAILVNGRGIDVKTEEHRLDYETPRATFLVQQGKRFRFRMINSGVQYCPLEVSIDNHNLTVIATDGNPIEPVSVVSFIILAGERVDFVVAANQKVSSYWIRLKGLEDCMDTSIYQTAILKYEGSLLDKPLSNVDYANSGPISAGLTLNPPNTKLTNETKDQYIGIADLKSTSDKHSTEYIRKITGKVDKQFFFAFDMNVAKNTDVYDNETYANDPEPWTSPQINNISCHMPSSPLLYQTQKIPKEMFCNQDSRQPACDSNVNEFCKCVHLIEIALNDLVEVIVVDGGSQGENHPVHLHGQSFAVLGMDKLGESVLIDDVKQLDMEGKLKRNLISPPIKDTVQIPSGGYTVFRFYADNPGIWFMHCHVEFHAESGMALIFKVGTEQQLPKQPVNWPQCGRYVNAASSAASSMHFHNYFGFLKNFY